jgi:hypothetical protein
MNREIRDECVKRLRSGKYKQGMGHLRNRDNEYCCLGVLCEIAVEKGIINMTVNEFSGYPLYGKDIKTNSFLPREVREWADMRSENGRIESLDDLHPTTIGKIERDTKYTSSTSLSILNDTGHSFDIIADVIEQLF